MAISILLFAAAAAALAVDVPVGRWCREHYGAEAAQSGATPRWLKFAGRLFETAEPFGHGTGAALIVVAVFLLDPARRWAIPRLATMGAGAGLVVDLIKILIERTRPHRFGFEGTVWSTFGDWLPLGSAGSAGQSLASGHTATAFGLAIALTWLYPRGRCLFFTLAVLVACQRVLTGAHWPSDVLAAAMVACLFAVFSLDIGPLARAFDRWETRWKQDPSATRERG